MTLLLDLGKGVIPVYIATAAGLDDATAAVIGLGAVFGHIFPIFAGFQGGKGVATTAGVFFVLSFAATLATVAVFLLVYGRSRIVSLASLSAAVALPLAMLTLNVATPVLFSAVVASCTVFATHRDNLRRLADGTEPGRRSRD